MSLGQGFPRKFRLRQRRDFLRVERLGKRVGGANFVVLSQQRAGNSGRLGVTVSRRVGGAVARNRVKRLVRETFRRQRALVPCGDTVVIARPGAAGLTAAAVAEELLRLWAQILAARSKAMSR